MYRYRKFRHALKMVNSWIIRMLPRRIYMKFYFLVAYSVNRITVKAVSRKKKIKLLSNLNLNTLKNSNTVFILGSGESINDLTKEQWEEIKRNDSIGLNFWIIHEYTPTLLVYEENLDRARNEQFYRILNSKTTFYERKHIIVKDIEYKGISTELINSNLRNNIYLSTEVVVPHNEEVDFINNIIELHRMTSKVNGHNTVKCLLKKSGSMSYLLLLALSMGYKKIVLCGVDLNNSNYFYDSDIYVDKPKNSFGEGQVHPTNLRQGDNLPMKDVILTINDLILKKYNIDLYISSKKSALYPDLNLFFKE